MARPSEYDFKMCVDICERISDGESIKVILKSNEDYPSFQTWCKWKRENDELLDLYTRSVQDKAESVDSEIDNIIEELKDKMLDPASARVIIDTLKWKASKYYPKMFGDKIDANLNHEGKIQIEQITGMVIK